jgi:predicted NBD/HSP70 family sugar kinase
MKFLTFDVGATKTRVALAGADGLGEVEITPTDHTPNGFARFLGQLQEQSEGQRISAVIGGMAGELEGPEGELVVSPNLPEWLGIPVLHRLQALFDCPIEVDNDTVLCGLGEAHNGSGITDGVMAYFTVSTGVNAVRLVDGMVDSSIMQFEIGAEVLAEKDGHSVTLEELAGGAALARRTGLAPSQIKDPAIWAVEAHELARGVYDTLIHWTPEIVVFGGSMMRDISLKRVAEELKSLPRVMEIPDLRSAKLGDEAGLQGALVRFRQLKLKK